MDAAQRHDDLSGEKFLRLGTDVRPHARDTTTIEHKPGHECIADDAQIVAAAHLGIEVADRRGCAPARPVAHRNRAKSPFMSTMKATWCCCAKSCTALAS